MITNCNELFFLLSKEYEKKENMRDLSNILSKYNGDDWKEYINNDVFEVDSKNRLKKVLIKENDKLMMKLIIWNENIESEIHNHEKKGNISILLEGKLYEELYLNNLNDNIKFILKKNINPNDISYIESDMILHKIISSEQKSYTINIYPKDASFIQKIYFV
jgi:hypothetical protein